MDLQTAAEQLAEQLTERGEQLVLAESCTGGLIASTLATIPGISKHLAGSMVVYQEASKIAWLGVDSETLQKHTAVSAQVAHQMAVGIMKATPHADVAASITGHLGPGAPAGQDGKVFIGVAHRGRSPKTWAIQLESTKRVARQREAAMTLIKLLLGRKPLA